MNQWIVNSVDEWMASWTDNEWIELPLNSWMCMSPRIPVLESALQKLDTALLWPGTPSSWALRLKWKTGEKDKALFRVLLLLLLMKLFEEQPIHVAPKASFISKHFSILWSYFRPLEKQGYCKSTYFGHSQPAMLTSVNDSCWESI